MEALLKKSAVKVLDNYEIIDWHLSEENLLYSITVESNLSVLDLECSMMVCFERRIVRRRTIAGI